MQDKADPFDARIELARSLADERRFGDAILMFNWLCEAYPDRAAAVIDSANAFSRVYDYDGVRARFAFVESRDPVTPDIWIAMAEISERLRRPQWVGRYLSNAIADSNPSAQACGLFALFLEHANDLDQSTELFERGLKLDPADESCQLARAKVFRRLKEFDRAESAIQTILNHPASSVDRRISSLYELGHIRDLQGDFAGAIEALLNAKQLTAQQPQFALFHQRAAGAEKIRHRFLTALTSDYFRATDAWKPANPQRMALLAGHPRSGTTLLEQVLDSHTDVICAEETMIFGNGVHDPFLRELNHPDICQGALRIAPARLQDFRTAYFSIMQQLLDQPIGDRLLIDKNPSYTDCIPVFARVFPEASCIIALRDPRDVVLSCFFQDLPVNDVTVHFQTLEQTAMRYANTMAMWLVCRENMDEKKWIEVRYESLVNDLPGESKRVMSKLNLKWQPAQARPDEHAKSRTVISPTYADVTQPVHQRAVGRWKRYEPWLMEAMPILETFIDAFDY